AVRRRDRAIPPRRARIRRRRDFRSRARRHQPFARRDGRSRHFLRRFTAPDEVRATARLRISFLRGHRLSPRPPRRIPRPAWPRGQAILVQTRRRLFDRNRRRGRKTGSRKSATVFRHARRHVLPRPHSHGRPSRRSRPALKRELRMHEAEVVRLERLASETQAELARTQEDQRRIESELEQKLAGHVEFEKTRVSAFHQFEQAREDLARVEQQVAEAQREVARLQAEAEQARARASEARLLSEQTLVSRATAEQEAAAATERLAVLRENVLTQQTELASRREELAAMAERLANAETLELRLAEESSQALERLTILTGQRDALLIEKTERESSNSQLQQQVEHHRSEKSQFEQRQVALEQQWNSQRERATALDEDLRARRVSLDEVRGNRSHREIEKARNDSDREHLRQTCISEASAQPEELIAQQEQLLTGEELVTTEASYMGIKERLESMGPVNMMALEEYQDCDQRNTFLTRERDDLVQSIQNTQQAITELDTVSQQKFEE